MFTGLIDNVRIYNRALSLSEIQTDMNLAIATRIMLPQAQTATLANPAAADAGVMTTSITPQQVASVPQKTVATLWSAAGIDASWLAALNRSVAHGPDWPSTYLDLALGNSSRIDWPRSGNGWFADASPTANSAAGRMDSLTAVLQEMTHRLGYLNIDDKALIGEFLAIESRLLPDAIGF